MAGLACSSDADCAGFTSPDEWCALPSTCDLTYGECLVRPRCVSPPWLACLNAAQKCVSIDTKRPRAPSDPVDPALVVALVILIVGGLLVAAGVIIVYGRHARHVPSVVNK